MRNHATVDSDVIENARLSVNSRLTGLDPTVHYGLSAFITQYLIWGQLFQLTDDNGVIPQLAEGIEHLPDKLGAIVRLKPGLIYSDGSAITADDVAYAFERNRVRHGPRFFLLDAVDTVRALDNRTVAFHFNRPFCNLELGLADAGFSILPRSAVEKDTDFFRHPISSGQFVLKDWTPGDDRWNLEENPHFYAGRSRVRRLEFVVTNDTMQQIQQLNDGSLDYAYDMAACTRSELRPEVLSYLVAIRGVEAIKFNHSRSGPLANSKVRQAISLAIDRKSICQRAYAGLTHPVTGFLYPGVAEAFAVLPNQGKRDLSSANALLATTGWHKGFRFVLQTWSQRPGRTEAALIIKENLSDLGIEVEVQPIADAAAISNLSAGDYEAQLSGNTQDPLTFLKNQFGEGGTITTKLRYRNPVITGLLTDAAATTGDARISLLHEAQRLAYADMPVIPLCDRVVLVANRLGAKFLYEANRQPGFNPAVMTQGGFSKCLND